MAKRLNGSSLAGVDSVRSRSQLDKSRSGTPYSLPAPLRLSRRQSRTFSAADKENLEQSAYLGRLTDHGGNA